MKQQICTQCLDILVDMINHPPKYPKDIVKLLGKAIDRYEEQGLEIPLKSYQIYYELLDKYEPNWKDEKLLYIKPEK